MNKIYLALLIAISQPALADKLKCKKCVDTRDIAKHSVTQSKLSPKIMELLQNLEDKIYLLEALEDRIYLLEAAEPIPIEAEPIKVGFTDHGATVTDNSTGLMWEVKDSNDGLENYSNPHDVDNLYTWTDLNDGDETNPDGTVFSDYLGKLNNPGFGGYTDWRIPSLEELQTILYAPEPCTGRLYGYCVVDPLFSVTTNQYYWTSTDWITPNSAYVIFFHHGHIAASAKYGTKHVRAVRSAR
jgi:hypothetical protein